MIKLILIFSLFYEYNFSPSLLSGNKFSTQGKAIALVHAPSILNPTNTGIMFSFAYSNPYAISGLNFFEGAISKNFKNFNIGAGYNYMGMDFYKEISYVLGLSLYKEGINLGFNLKYLYLYIRDTITKGVFSTDAGISFSIIKPLKIGLFFLNFNSPALLSKRIYPSGSLSLAFKESKFLETFFDLNYEGEFTSFSLAQKFYIMKNITLSAGICNQPPVFSISLELLFDKINFLYSFRNHTLLGGFSSYEIDFKR